MTLLRRRAREAILQLVNELYEGSPEFGGDGEYRDSEEVGAGATAGANAWANAWEARRPGLGACLVNVRVKLFVDSGARGGPV